MTAGVAAARREPKGGWTRYGPPSYWSKLGRSRGTRDKRDYIARKIADANGVSMSTARREVLPYLATMTHHCKNRELTVAMTACYDLDAEHVSFVTGSGETTNKVQSIVGDAEELREEASVEGSQGAFEGSEDVEAPAESDGDESGGADGGEIADTEEAVDDGLDEAEKSKLEAAAEDDEQAGLSDFM